MDSPSPSEWSKIRFLITKLRLCSLEENPENIKIRKIILLEYYYRLHKKSKNPEMHFFNIPELKEIDNEIITVNAIYLIDENFVRGGVDIEGEQRFPWIARILPKGIAFIEDIITN